MENWVLNQADTFALIFKSLNYARTSPWPSSTWCFSSTFEFAIMLFQSIEEQRFNKIQQKHKIQYCICTIVLIFNGSKFEHFFHGNGIYKYTQKHTHMCICTCTTVKHMLIQFMHMHRNNKWLKIQLQAEWLKSPKKFPSAKESINISKGNIYWEL